jgi:hypothetical protein
MAGKSRRSRRAPKKAPAKKNTSPQEIIVERLQKKGNKIGKTVSTIIPQLGSLAGNYLGGPLGGAVGLAAGKLISSITGYGDYTVNRNTVLQANSVPTFRQGGDGMVVRHREFIMNVMGNPTFMLQSFPLNPGMASTFPWLARVAHQFEEYEMNGLVFEYRPSSGSAVASANPALGVVIFATDYDAANPSFPDKQTMESYEFSTSTVPFTACMHPVECMRGRNVLNNLYIREGLTPASTDIRLYDMGNFQIATEGMQTTNIVGELWVTYDVLFRKPRIPGALTFESRNFLHLSEGPVGTSLMNQFFGTVGAVRQPESTMNEGYDYLLNATSGIVLPFPGIYAVFFITEVDSAVSNNVTTNIGSNVVPGPSTMHGSHYRYSAPGGIGPQFICYYVELLVSAAGPAATNFVNVFLNEPATTGYLDFFVATITRDPVLIGKAAEARRALTVNSTQGTPLVPRPQCEGKNDFVHV